MEVAQRWGAEGAEKAEGAHVANCPAAFLSYFHCGFVMKYNNFPIIYS